jgi:hypothetical protein
MMHDIPDLLEGLRRTPAILKEFVESIPEQKLNLRRGAGFWTIAEHVSHLAQVQQMPISQNCEWDMSNGTQVNNSNGYDSCHQRNCRLHCS